jgi:hypothetical protein
MLAVGVEGQDRVVAVPQRPLEAKAQRRALALVRALLDDGRPRSMSLSCGVVRRAVIDDEDGQVLEGRTDDRPDPRTLVVARDQGDEAGCQRGPSEASRSTP